ncbi:MAG: hypothetical protein R6T90_10905, partial [Dissulfuribacterales bacterium]
MFDFIRKSFANKIMATVIISLVLFLAAEIIFRVYFGTKDRIEMAATFNVEVAESIFSGIKYPMHIGNSEAVMKVLSNVGAKMEDIEAWVCDFEQEITWSTHKEKEETYVADSISDEELLRALRKALSSGVPPEKSFDVELRGRKILVTIQPILNHQDCYHCHGSSRKVLGGMLVGADVERAYSMVATARNRSILISFIGISLIITIIYAMMTRFITQPVKDLA